jgi:hypothetical protein
MRVGDSLYLELYCPQNPVRNSNRRRFTESSPFLRKSYTTMCDPGEQMQQWRIVSFVIRLANTTGTGGCKIFFFNQVLRVQLKSTYTLMYPGPESRALFLLCVCIFFRRKQNQTLRK